MKNCPVKKCVMSVIAVFIFLNLYGMFVHGHLLMDDYRATASLWRSEAEMNSMMGGWMAYYAALAIVLTCFFKKFRAGFAACSTDTTGDATSSCCPIKSGGLCFGLKVGLIMGLVMASSYLYMPIPLALAVKWLIAGVVEGLGVGIILGVCSGKKGDCTAKS